MQKYYLRVRVDGQLLQEPAVTEAGTAHAAMQAATEMGKEIALAGAADGNSITNQSIEVTDASGHVLGIVPILPFSYTDTKK